MAFNHRKSLTLKPNKIPNFATKFDAGSCYFCYICPDNCDLSPQPPPPPPPLSELSDPTKYHIPTVLILMLCILGLAFLILSYLTISRYRNSRRRNPSPETLTANFADENHGPMSDHPIWLIRTVGLPQSVIDSIASFEYQKSDGLIDGNDCAVCLNDFRPKETLRLLPKCSHAFHLDCIDTWLRSHKNCPVCRAPIAREDGAIESNQTTSQSRQNGGEIERENDESRENRAIVIQSDDVARSDKLRVFSDLSDRTVRMESSDQHSPPASGRSVSVDLLYEIRDEGCSDQQK